MKKYISRTVFILAAVLLISCNKIPRVLIIVGGHSYDTTEFYNMFHSMEDIEFDSVSHPHARELLQSSGIGGYDLLIFYDFIPDMQPIDSSIYVRLTMQGQSMLFLHHAIGTFQEWDGYMDMVGGRYVMSDHSQDTTLYSDYKHDIEILVEVLDNEHPVTRGLEDFTIHDEGYTNIQINEGIHPLFGTGHPDCAPIMGWVNYFNNATCLYLMFGHDRYAYENESLQQILQNSIYWLSEK